MAATILLYNCNGPQWKELHKLMMLVRLRLRPVNTEQFAVSIGDLAKGKGDIAATPYEGEGFTEPMVVLCNLNAAQMNPVLEVIRRAKIPCQPIKAMMTQTNMSWDSMALYEELCRERTAMEKKKASAESGQE